MGEDLYAHRKLTEGHPDIERRYLAEFSDTLASAGDDVSRLERWLRCLDRLVDLAPPRRMCVIGCGPRPVTLRHLLALGHDAVGVEPYRPFVTEAQRFVGRGADAVLEGATENIPLPDGSQDIVFCENVLEHVDSPSRSLAEMYRVAAPGAVAMIYTTNRHRVRLRGDNGEFTVPYFNWFPALVKEAFVVEHLLHRPQLANFSSRPAVHWYTYTELCRLGREAGFAQFYGLPDVMDPADPAIAGSALRSLALRSLRRSPWLRALAMSQLGHLIFMVKRR